MIRRLITESKTQLQKMMLALEGTLKNIGLKVNLEKTKLNTCIYIKKKKKHFTH